MPLSGGQSSFSSNWLPLSLNTGISNFGSSFFNASWRLEDKRVYLRGVLQTNGNTSILAQVPIGYRPTNTVWVPIVTQSSGGVRTIGSASVDSSGYINLVTGSNWIISLDGISFPI